MQGILETVTNFGALFRDIALQWLLSPQAWVQFALLVGCYFAALIFTKRAIPLLRRVLNLPDRFHQLIRNAAQLIVDMLPLLLPFTAYVLTAMGEAAMTAVFGGGAVIAFGKRVFLFLAIRAFVNETLKDSFLRMLGRVFLVPIGFLYALGLWPSVSEILSGTVVPLGNLSFNLLDLLRFVGIGGFIFWLGSWSNSQSSHYIDNQKEMRPAIRQLSAKTAEMAIFGTAFIVFLSIMEIPLSSFAVLGGAIGVGLGFGLQKIASNFISGVILLLEGQATVGDYVELDGGEAGTIVKMTARAAILETFDGRWIVVPNEDFIITRVVNYSDSGSANRYEAAFTVGYDTDINLIPKLIEDAVAKNPDVLSKPFPPDCELRALGDNGVEFAVEFWVNGIDDGKNKFTSDVLFIIWNTLKDNNITIPYPQRVVHHRGDAQIS